MATITFTLSSADATRIVNALGAGHEENIINEEGQEVSNPQTKAQFAQNQLAQLIKGKVIQHERQEARRALQEPSAFEITVE